MLPLETQDAQSLREKPTNHTRWSLSIWSGRATILQTLAYTGTGAFSMGHGILRDADDGTNLAQLSLPVSGAPHSLSYNKDIQIGDIIDLPEGAFVTTWETTAANDPIYIPLNVHTGGTLTIDWGDGSANSTVTADGTVSHTYTDSDKYRVSMTGALSGINLGDLSSTEAAKLASIDQWGIIGWSTMEAAFRGSRQHGSTAAIDAPDLLGV